MRDLAILLLGTVIAPKEMHTYFHWHLLEMFIATLFIITKSRNYPNIHNPRKDFKTVVYSHNLILQLHDDENEQSITNSD